MGNVMTDFTIATNITPSKTIFIDNTAPTISSVTTTTNSGNYKQGEVIPLTVTFSEAVTSAEVTVNTNTSRSCTFSISNSSTGSCNYTVQAGDNTGALSISSISGTITDQVSIAMSSFTIGTNLNAAKTIVLSLIHI